MTSSLGPRAFQLKHSPPAREARTVLRPRAPYFFFVFFDREALSWITSRPRSTFSPSSLN